MYNIMLGREEDEYAFTYLRIHIKCAYIGISGYTNVGEHITRPGLRFHTHSCVGIYYNI